MRGSNKTHPMANAEKLEEEIEAFRRLIDRMLDAGITDGTALTGAAMILRQKKRLLAELELAGEDAELLWNEHT